VAASGGKTRFIITSDPSVTSLYYIIPYHTSRHSTTNCKLLYGTAAAAVVVSSSLICCDDKDDNKMAM